MMYTGQGENEAELVAMLTVGFGKCTIKMCELGLGRYVEGNLERLDEVCTVM